MINTSRQQQEWNLMNSIFVGDSDVIFDDKTNEFLIVITDSSDQFQSIRINAFDEHLNQYILNLIDDINNNETIELTLSEHQVGFTQKQFNTFWVSFVDACVYRDKLDTKPHNCH